MLLDAQNPADLNSAPADRQPRTAIADSDAASARPRAADDPAAASIGSGGTERLARTDSAESQAGDDERQIDTVHTLSEHDNADDAPSGPAVKPPDVAAANDVAAIVLALVGTSVDKLASNAGDLAQFAMSRGQLLLHQIPASVVGTEHKAELPPSGAISASSDATPPMSDSTPTSIPASTDSMVKLADDQVEIIAQSAAEAAAPKTKSAAQSLVTSATSATPASSATEPAAPDLVPPFPPRSIETVASAAAASTAARSSAPSAPGNATEPSNIASPVKHAAPETIGHTATPPPDAPEAPLPLAPLPQSLPKLSHATPSDATPSNAETSSASTNSSVSVLSAKADSAVSFETEGNTNSGANAETKHHASQSAEPLNRPVLENNFSPLNRPASAVPTAFEPTPGLAPAATANPPAPSHSAPAAAPAHVPPGGPIALADLPLAIALQTKNGRSRFAIRLDPPELGRIDVRLDIDNRSNVMLRLVTERPETLDLLRRDAAHIERALQDAGLKTGEQTLQFSLQNHSDGGDNTPPPSPHLLPAQDETPSSLPQIYMRAAGLGSGVDIRV